MRLVMMLLVVGSVRVAVADDVESGARVRVVVDGESIVGQVAETTADTVVITRGGQRVAVPARSIKELEVSEGRQSQTVNWGFKGFFIGIGVGAAVTLALGPGGDEN